MDFNRLSPRAIILMPESRILYPPQSSPAYQKSDHTPLILPHAMHLPHRGLLLMFFYFTVVGDDASTFPSFTSLIHGGAVTGAVLMHLLLTPETQNFPLSWPALPLLLEGHRFCD